MDASAWRAVVPEVADKFLACGVLEHGFARVRCDACAHEYLLAFSSKARYFCPSCHAKRLALWTQRYYAGCGLAAARPGAIRTGGRSADPLLLGAGSTRWCSRWTRRRTQKPSAKLR